MMRWGGAAGEACTTHSSTLAGTRMAEEMTAMEEGMIKATPPLGLADLPLPTVAGAGMTRLPGKPFSHLAAVAEDQ